MNTRANFELNNIYRDDFGRPSGVLLMNKEAGISSHDLVDKVRRKLGTKKVGHAGALDVFSSGLMLILVGKATKLANTLLSWDKAYIARIVFGLFNYTQDPEGRLLSIKSNVLPEQEKIISQLESMLGANKQFVSIYSSVKVNGVKLRKLLRDPRYDFAINETADTKKIILKRKETGEVVKEVNVPRRDILIYDIKLLETGLLKGSDLPFSQLDKDEKYGYADIYVKCSKGTYIRQLGDDIAKALGTNAVLAQLQRCELGQYDLNQVIAIEEIA
jgi:tRNA pseudouridine55 synthase